MVSPTCYLSSAETFLVMSAVWILNLAFCVGTARWSVLCYSFFHVQVVYNSVRGRGESVVPSCFMEISTGLVWNCMKTFVSIVTRRIWCFQRWPLTEVWRVTVLVECWVFSGFTSTETVEHVALGTGAQDGHLDFHTAPELWSNSNTFLLQIVEGLLSADACPSQSRAVGLCI